MITTFKEKTIYDFLHLFFSGHLKKKDLADGIINYLEETPKELRVRINDNIGLLQETFIDVLYEVLERYEPEYEKFVDQEFTRLFSAHHKVQELNELKNKKYFTIKETSHLLHKSTRTIHNYFKSGKLIRETVNDEVYVTGESVRKLMPNLNVSKAA